MPDDTGPVQSLMTRWEWGVPPSPGITVKCELSGQHAWAFWCSRSSDTCNLALTCGYPFPCVGQANNTAGHRHRGSSPSRTHAGLPTELPVSYRQNCGGDRFLLCLRGLTSALAVVWGLFTGCGQLVCGVLAALGVAAAGLVAVVVVAVGLRVVSRRGGSRAGWCGVGVPAGWWRFCRRR